MTEADLLFAVAVLESTSSALEPDDRLAAARREVSDRYRELKAGRSFTEASWLARAEWLGRFLAAREAALRAALAEVAGAEPMTLEQAVRDLLAQAVEDGLVALACHGWDDPDPRRRSSGELTGVANLLGGVLWRFLAAREGEARRAGELEVLLAWESGELSEGQVCQLLGGAGAASTDPVTAREMREAALAAARKRWERWRACNPPSPGSAP
jgi:hypothetical protein